MSFAIVLVLSNARPADHGAANFVFLLADFCESHTSRLCNPVPVVELTSCCFLTPINSKGLNLMTSDLGAKHVAPKKSNALRWFLCCSGLFVVVAVCALLFIFGGGLTFWQDTQRGMAVGSQAGTAVTADELTKDYIDDPHAADAKYKNKVLIVSGKIVVVEKDRLSLAGTPPVDGRLPNSVHCYVPTKNQGQLANLQADEVVKVKGYFSGELVPIIKLEQCQIEK